MLRSLWSATEGRVYKEELEDSQPYSRRKNEESTVI